MSWVFGPVSRQLSAGRSSPAALDSPAPREAGTPCRYSEDHSGRAPGRSSREPRQLRLGQNFDASQSRHLRIPPARIMQSIQDRIQLLSDLSTKCCVPIVPPIVPVELICYNYGPKCKCSGLEGRVCATLSFEASVKGLGFSLVDGEINARACGAISKSCWFIIYTT